MSRGRAWSPDDDTRLQAARGAGKTHAQIAEELRRPLSSIASRLGALGLTKPSIAREPRAAAGATATAGPDGRRPRRCLNCGNEFDSANAGNRLCYKCRREAVNASPYAP